MPKCNNCGADLALHHYETRQCPVNGVEAPIGRRQEWQNQTFVEYDPVREAAHELLSALENVTAFAAQYTKGGCNVRESMLLDSYRMDMVEIDYIVKLARSAIARAKGVS